MTVIGGAQVEFTELPGRHSGDPLQNLGAASSLRVSRPERTASRLAHVHPHSEEVIYVKSGSGAVYIEGEFHRIEPGDTVLVPAGAAHATVPDAGSEMELICFFPHPNLQDNIQETDIEVMKEVRE